MSSWYKITSMTLWGNLVEICIYPTGCDTSKDPEELKAASEPFEMETDDSTDIDTTIRETTGTLRFIVEDADVLDTILPSTPFDTLVVVTCAGTVKFKGFVEVTDYTQAWDGTPYEFELPVQGRLSLMDKINVQPNDDTEYAIERNFAYYIRDAFRDMYVAAGGASHDTIEVEAVAFNVFPSNVVLVAGSFSNPSQCILSQLIQREWFLSETSEEDDNGYSTAYMEGCTWAEAFSKVLLPYSMDMWIENDTLYMRSQYPSTHYYSMAWSYLSGTWADGGSISQGSSSVSTKTGVENWFQNLSSSNSVGWVEPYRNINVTRKLEKTELFEISQTWVNTFKLKLGYLDDTAKTNSFYFFHTTSYQRGFNLHSYELTSDRDIVEQDQEDAMVEVGQYSTSQRTASAYYGMTLGDLQVIDKEEYSTTQSFTNLAPSVFVYGKEGAFGSTREMLTVKPSVVMYPSRRGYICLNASISFYKKSSDSPYYITGTSQKPDSRTLLGFKLEAYNLNTGKTYQTFNGYWIEKSSSERHDKLIFGKGDETNDLLPNTVENASVAYTDRYLSYVSIYNSLKYDGIEGLAISFASTTPIYEYDTSNSPFYTDTGVCLGDDPYQLTLRIYGLSSDETDSDCYIAKLDNIKLTYCPQKIDGDLSVDDTSMSTSKTANNIPVNTEKCKVYAANGGEYGEDADISLDSWDDEYVGQVTITGKDNRTVQPSMPVWHDGSDQDVYVSGSGYEYHTGRFQWAKKRRLLTLDDAKALTDTPWAFRYAEDNKNYRLIASGWKASNEGGKKVFIEVL